MEMDPVRLSIKCQGSTCEVLIEEGLLSRAKPNLESMLSAKPSSIVIITDSNLQRKYAGTLSHELSRYARTNVISFRAGEKRKTFATLNHLLSRLASLKVDRKGVVICLGGGVVGDLGGFAASIYKRGITYFQFPTTLLAQVDSSMGGKTGVDTGWGKNQIGTFCHPRGVFIDPLCLDTLPKSELINGVGEIVKYSIVASRRMFDRLSKIDFTSLGELKRFIPDCCRLKAEIVSKDEREENLRYILNYGHTLGHAIESASGYSVSHGRSVILGMLGEGWVAHQLGIFDREDFEKQEAVLLGFKLGKSVSKLKKKEMLEFGLVDKKASDEAIMMSLPERIGKMHPADGSFKTPVSRELFNGSFEYLRALFH